MGAWATPGTTGVPRSTDWCGEPDVVTMVTSYSRTPLTVNTYGRKTTYTQTD